MNTVTSAVNVYRQHVQILAWTLIAASVLYFLAANWWMLAHAVQLAIPILAFIAAVCVSLTLSQDVLRQTAQAIAGLMQGLSLAVIGQVYQTGADSYLLFLLWSLLLLPWLYQRNAAIFLLLCLCSQLTIFLFFQQTLWLERMPWLYSLSLNMLMAGLLAYSVKYYAKLSHVLVIALGMLSIGSMLCFVLDDYAGYWLASSAVLPSIAGYYFYRRQRGLDVGILTASVGVAFSVLLADVLIRHLSSEIAFFLIFAFATLLLFSGFAYVMLRYLPQHNFAQIPLAIGAWLSAWALLALLSILFESQWGLIAFCSALAWGVALWLLRRTTGIFKRHFAYCLMIFGQVGLSWSLWAYFEQLWLVLAVQLICSMLVFWRHLHWLVLLLQLLASYIFALALMHELCSAETWIWAIYLLNYSVLTTIALTLTHLPAQQQASVFILALAVLLANSFMPSMLGLPSSYVLEACLALGCMLCMGYLYIRQWHMRQKLAVLVVSLVLVACGYFEIVVVMALAAWALQQRKNFLYAFTVICLALLLWQLYYDLGSSFLYKSATIFISGCALLMFARAFSPSLPQEN